jgi:hypothetical protein
MHGVTSRKRDVLLADQPTRAEPSFGLTALGPGRRPGVREEREMDHRVWDPSAGERTAKEQRPERPATVRSDGSVREQRSVASEGPCLTEVGGGAGGEPDGRSLPIHRVSWD